MIINFMKNKFLSFSLVITLSLLCVSCTRPIEIYLQNLKEAPLIIYGKLTNREHFNKLPNRVSIYTLSMDEYENWIKNDYLTWKDSINYKITIPGKSQVKISQLSDRLALGIGSPSVKIYTNEDTIFIGDGRDFQRLYDSNRWERVKKHIYKIEVK